MALLDLPLDAYCARQLDLEVRPIAPDLDVADPHGRHLEGRLLPGAVGLRLGPCRKRSRDVMAPCLIQGQGVGRARGVIVQPHPCTWLIWSLPCHLPLNQQHLAVGQGRDCLEVQTQGQLLAIDATRDLYLGNLDSSCEIGRGRGRLAGPCLLRQTHPGEEKPTCRRVFHGRTP